MEDFALWGAAPSVPLAAGILQPPLTRTWGTGETFSDLLGAATGYFENTRQSPRRFRPAEGADPECGRVGVCMSVDPERHTLTHTHSHARTHTGPSAAPPAPPQTFTPQVRSSRVPRAVPSPCRWLPTKGEGRIWGPGQGETAGSPHHPDAAVLALPRPPGEGEGERVPGALTAPAAECARERRAGPAPPRRQGRRGRGRRAGREGGQGGGRPSCHAPRPAQAEPRPRGRPAPAP